MAGAVYGFNFWLPTILKKLSGHSNLFVTTVGALPYCIGLIATLLVGWSSDRTRERRWHAALCMIIASLGLGLSVVSHRTDLAVLMFCLAAVGMYGYLSAFWSRPSSFLPRTAPPPPIRLLTPLRHLLPFSHPPPRA